MTAVPQFTFHHLCLVVILLLALSFRLTANPEDEDSDDPSLILFDGTSAQEFREKVDNGQYLAGRLRKRRTDSRHYFVNHPKGNLESLLGRNLFGMVIRLKNPPEDKFSALPEDRTWVCVFEVLEDDPKVPLCEWIGIAKRSAFEW